jgi:hypothetical protein
MIIFDWDCVEHMSHVYPSIVLFLSTFNSHREEITAERLAPFRVFIITNPRDQFTSGEVSRLIIVRHLRIFLRKTISVNTKFQVILTMKKEVLKLLNIF